MIVRMIAMELKNDVSVKLELSDYNESEREIYKLIKYICDRNPNTCISIINDEDGQVFFGFRNNYEKGKIFKALDEYAKERKMFLQLY